MPHPSASTCDEPFTAAVGPTHLAADLSAALVPRLDVLVVEDDDRVRRGLELSLGHLGHLVFAVSTIAAARSLLRGFQVDVVVCDYSLPDGDACALLDGWPTGQRRVPAIVISGRIDGLARCREAGVDAFLSKSLAFDELARMIRTLATGR